MSLERATASWRKSTYSQGLENCVEVNSELTEGLSVRDSKAPSVGVLEFPAEAWSSFVDEVRGRGL